MPSSNTFAFVGALGLATTALAGVVPRENCCFQLTASGGVSGVLGQLDDGQNRVGGGHPTGTYCINDGGLTDSHNRGCILTPPTSQWQCDVGASPTRGFSVGADGALLHDGSSEFWACPASEVEYNIYVTPVPNQKKCVKVGLNTDGNCKSAQGSQSAAPSPPPPASSASYPVAPGPPSSMMHPKPSNYSSISHIPASSEHPYPETSASTPHHAPGTYSGPPGGQTTPSYPGTAPPASSSHASQMPPSTPSSGKACPASLGSTYETPHLIVPVSSSQPDKAFGTQYNATINASPRHVLTPP
jgi:hypothetical protein